LNGLTGVQNLSLFAAVEALQLCLELQQGESGNSGRFSTVTFLSFLLWGRAAFGNRQAEAKRLLSRMDELLLTVRFVGVLSTSAAALPLASPLEGLFGGDAAEGAGRAQGSSMAHQEGAGSASFEVVAARDVGRIIQALAPSPERYVVLRFPARSALPADSDVAMTVRLKLFPAALDAPPIQSIRLCACHQVPANMKHLAHVGIDYCSVSSKRCSTASGVRVGATYLPLHEAKADELTPYLDGGTSQSQSATRHATARLVCVSLVHLPTMSAALLMGNPEIGEPSANHSGESLEAVAENAARFRHLCATLARRDVGLLLWDSAACQHWLLLADSSGDAAQCQSQQQSQPQPQSQPQQRCVLFRVAAQENLTPRHLQRNHVLHAADALDPARLEEIDQDVQAALTRLPAVDYNPLSFSNRWHLRVARCISAATVSATAATATASAAAAAAASAAAAAATGPASFGSAPSAPIASIAAAGFDNESAAPRPAARKPSGDSHAGGPASRVSRLALSKIA
jgi:hypothetical protein